MSRQKAADVVGCWVFGGEEGVAELLLEVAVEVEVGAARVDEDAPGVVVQEERDVHGLSGDLDPFFILAALFPLPNVGAVVVARPGGDRRDHGVGADRQAADFDHPHGGTANLGKWCVEDEATAQQESESVDEEADAGGDADEAPEQEAAVVGRTKE